MYRLVILIALMLMPFVVFGEGENQTKKEIPIEPLNTTPLTRPQMPSHQEITCEYSDGCLILNFRYPEGVCELTVTECDGNESSYIFDSATDACIYVGTISTAHLLITTEYGHTYVGEM